MLYRSADGGAGRGKVLRHVKTEGKLPGVFSRGGGMSGGVSYRL